MKYACLLLLCFYWSMGSSSFLVAKLSLEKMNRKKILETSGLISNWDFDLKERHPKKSRGKTVVNLKEGTTREVSIEKSILFSKWNWR